MKGFLTVLLLCALLVFPGAASAASVQPVFFETAGHPAERDIQLVGNLGIMVGIGAEGPESSPFAPSEPVSKSQLAVVLQRLFQFDYGNMRFVKQPAASDYYQDVSEEAWYAEAALMGAINNVFPANGYFSPDRGVTRLDVAQAVYRSFQAKNISIPMIMLMPVFEDTAALTQEEVNAVVFVHNTGIMQGHAGFFRPYAPVERWELASVLARSVDLIAIGPNDSGLDCQVSPGKTVVVVLPSNPTTGYSWSLSQAGDPGQVSLATNFYLADPADQILMGQGGNHYWQFKALQPGKTQLELVYARPWESVAPLSVFTLPITVR